MNQNHNHHELGTVNSNSTHAYVGTYSDISGSQYRHKDEHTLARLGKKQVLKVRTFNNNSPSLALVSPRAKLT